MIDINIAHDLRERIASKVDINVLSRDMAVIYMPLVFNDGDHLSIYMERTGKGTWHLTDQGDIASRASYVGANLADDKYAQKAASIASFYGVESDRGQLGMKTSESGLSDAVFTFTQACLETSWLFRSFAISNRMGRSNAFPQRLAKVIHSCIAPEKITANYHDDASDPKRNYPVDYRIEGRVQQLFLFGVGGPNSCMRATIACQHYRMAEVPFTGVAVYKNEERLPKRYTEPLNDVVNRHFPRVTEAENLRKYLLDNAA